MSKIRKLLITVVALLSITGVVTTSVLYFKGKNELPLVNPNKKFKVTIEGLTKDNILEVFENNTFKEPKNKLFKKEGFLFLGFKEKGKNEFYDFSKGVKSNLVLVPSYYSLEIFETAKPLLEQEEKYSKETFEAFKNAYELANKALNDKDLKNEDKIKLIEALKGTYKELKLKQSTNPTTEKIHITYELDGGQLNNLTTEIDKDTKLNKPTSDPVKEGYKFLGWYSDQAREHEFNFETALSKDTTIYAKYEINVYDIEAVVNDGELENKLQKVEHGKKANPFENPTRLGHRFVGWYEDQEFTKQFDFEQLITANKKVYPKFEKEELTITLNPQDGTLTSESSIKVLYGEKATKPSQPTKEGHNFVGWYKEAEGTNEFVFENEIITSNIEIFAKWELTKYSVTFNLNGGNIDGNTDNIVKEVSYDQLVEKLEKDPVKEGLEFYGWVLDESKIEKFDFDNQKIKSNLTLIAHFEIQGYVVTFELKDGETMESPVRVKVAENATVSRPEHNPVKENHEFDNWYKNEDLTELFDFDAQITADTKIYPKFTRTHSFLTYDLQGGTLEGHDLKVKVAVGQHAPAFSGNPTKEGHTFIGWFNSTDESATEFKNNEVVINEDKTVYAKYSVQSYTVMFLGIEATEASSYPEQQVVYNQYVNKPATTPTKPGHRFVNWYTENVGGEVFDFEHTQITGPISIYARFEVEKYNVTFDLKDGVGTAEK